MINDQRTLASVVCQAQPKRHAPGGLARIDDRRSELDRYFIFHAIAKPPSTFGRQMVLDEAGSPFRGHSVHHTRKMGKHPGFWTGTQSRNRRTQSPPKTAFERHPSLPKDRTLAYQEMRLRTRLAQERSCFERRLARSDDRDLAVL